MPEWTDRTEIKNALNQLWVKIDEEIHENPTFEEVAGLPSDVMGEHAAEAVKAFMDKSTALDLLDPNTWIQVYMVGFLVGKRYGESPQHSVTAD